MSKPKISVIIPAFNAQDFLAEALESVFSQTLPPQEILVYNDASSDNTQKVIDSYGSRLRSLPTQPGPSKGPAFARNQCLRAALGDYLAFLDADDLWLPKKLELQLSYLQAQSQPTAVFGMIQEFNASGPLGHYQRCALSSVCLLPTILAHNIGTFDEKLIIGDFADWLARLKTGGVYFVYLDEPLARRRHHQNNLGKRASDKRPGYLEVVRRKLSRERSQSQGQKSQEN